MPKPKQPTEPKPEPLANNASYGPLPGDQLQPAWVYKVPLRTLVRSSQVKRRQESSDTYGMAALKASFPQRASSSFGSNTDDIFCSPSSPWGTRSSGFERSSSFGSAAPSL